MLWLSPTLTSFFFPSPPPWVSVKFLRIHIRVKPYGICLSLYGLFHLTSHSPVPSTLLQRAIFHSFSLPRSAPLCIYINHNFFIHSSVDGHLGSFHNLAIVESAAINIGVKCPYASALLYPLGKFLALFFFPLPLPHGLLLSFSGST